MEEQEGFIVHTSYETAREGSRLYLIGRSADGGTFAVVEERARPGFYIRQSDASRVREILSASEGRLEESGLHTMDGEPCVRLSWAGVSAFQQAAERLPAQGVRTYEADIRFGDQYLMERGIHGFCRIRGSARPGRRVDQVFMNPTVEPCSGHPALSVLSIDIETDGRGRRIYAVGMAFRNPMSGETREEVLFAGPVEEGEGVMACEDEETMLRGFCARMVEWDPDIVTGWNVIDFDFRVIWNRIRRHGAGFQVGRSEREAVYLLGEERRSNTVILPGRQVLDGARAVRASPERFSDYTLETVASSVLGRGKILEQRRGEGKIEAIQRLHREDPRSLCLYCLEDARLVLDILERTGLLDLTYRRSMLTGVSLDRAWTSIASFEHLYIEAMHRRGTVAPTAGVDPFPTAAAPGGAILGPHTGLFDNVWLFDFRSLYPSIILTFNIDPLAFVPPAEADALPAESRGEMLRAPNGACFRREPAILPDLLERFFRSRAEAKERGDSVASYVYKIIMNSFYGVLGAPSCRFASGYLAGAITGLGQRLLRWCEDYLQRLGYRVIYGDTDSLFVLSGVPVDGASAALVEEGERVCRRINEALAEFVREEYAVDSRLELEFEKVYYRFFLPPVRSPGPGVNARGRAKGYAGLTLPVSELSGAKGGGGAAEEGAAEAEEGTAQGRPGWIEIRGMEAVRRDWTDLAQGFQVGLLELLFRGAPPAAVKAFVRRLVEELQAGRLDDRLTYRKALRKSVAEYTRSQPPHVRAAAMLAPEEQRGLIEYVWTVDGPQPVSRASAPLDYAHYVERQLKPIARGFEEVLKTDVASLFGEGKQLELF